MAEQITITIPKTCKECYTSDFKLARPHCYYEKAYHLQESFKFFMEELNMELPIDVNAFLAEIRPKAKSCLANIDKRAGSIIREKQEEQRIAEQNKKNEENKKQLDELSVMVKHLLDNQNPDNIFRHEHIETETKEVHKHPLKMTFDQSNPMDKPSIRTPDKLKHEKKPVGGWLRYQRNVKNENIKKYLKKLKEVHPDLSAEIDKVLDGKPSEVVRLGTNKAGRAMIDYRDMK